MIVYKLTAPSGKAYIGVANDLHARFRTHAKGRHAIGRAIRKYGAETFQKEILLIADPEVCYQFEAGLIVRLNTLAPNGYNLVGGGHGIRQHSDEVLKKMSASIKRSHARPEYRAGASARTKVQWSDPEKLRQAQEKNILTWSSPEKRAEHSKTMKKVFSSEAHRKKMSDVSKRSWAKPETREKMLARVAARPRGPNGAFLKRIT